MLTDNHGRIVDYARIAITDRCNLRCTYCMPADGLDWLKKSNILSYEELFQTIEILAELGFKKIRFTGGEPFARKDFHSFLKKVCVSKLIPEVHLTTNGILAAPYIHELANWKLAGVNFSLDSLDEKRFYEITRQNQLNETLAALHSFINSGIKTKINAVVMADKNIEDIIPLCELAFKNDIEVRFIEEMPFNGGARQSQPWNAPRILKHIENVFGKLTPANQEANATASRYTLAGSKGSIGIIAAFSRTFCGTCNRLRFTPSGEIKTCLYEKSSTSWRDVLRSGADKDELKQFLANAVSKRFANGFEAEKQRSNIQESMATIGG